MNTEDIKLAETEDDFSLESILSEFGGSGGEAREDVRLGSESVPIAVPTDSEDDDDVRIYEVGSIHKTIDFDKVVRMGDSYTLDEKPLYPEEPSPEPEPEPESEPESAPDLDGIIAEVESPGYSEAAGPAPDAEEEPAQEDTYTYRGQPVSETAEGLDDVVVEPADYAAAAEDDYSAVSDSPEPDAPEKDSARSFRETVSAPLISALALIAMRLKQSNLNLHAEPPEEAEDLGAEMPPEKAVKFYEKHIPGLRLRCRLAFIVSLVLVYISYGLPVFGALNGTKTASAVCLMLLLTVMMLGLDVITAGLMSLARRRPDANSLIALSCVISAIDALIIAVAGSKGGLPFCAVPALALAFSLLGSVLNCRADRIVFRLASLAKRPYTLSAETSVTGSGVTLLKSTRKPDGFVRRTEESGPDEAAYGVLAPYVIVAALVLSLVAALICKSFSSFAHILSGIFIAAAPLTILFSFPLPFFISAKSLIRSGSAIAGWSGLYDIGKSRHVIITDRDLFPKTEVTVEKVRILSGVEPDKVISFAGSIISASGSSMVPAFSELMSRGNGSLQRVDEFTCHESGGLVALINGEEVLCGTSGFMQLMGVRLPQKFSLKNCVYIAISGVLCGIFELRYTPTKDVRESLGLLMQSNRHPVFAIRDFNVTPQMLSRKFDMPTDGFDFPTFAERYEISAAEPSEGSKPAALISHEGIAPMVKLAMHAEKLYAVIRVCVLMSVLCTVIGIAAAFITLLSGGVAALSVSRALTYMLLWLLPEIGLAIYLARR